MCSAATTYTSLKESGLKPGDWAVFPGGGGGVGIQGVQLAVAMGLRVIVVDSGEARSALAKKYGAEHFVDFKEGDPVAKVVELTGGGAHAVYVTAVQAYPVAHGYLGARQGGKVMCIGLPPAGQFDINIPPAALIFRGQSIQGTLVSSLGDLDATLQFAARGKFHLSVTVLEHTNIQQANYTSSPLLLDLAAGTTLSRSSKDQRSRVVWLSTSTRNRIVIDKALHEVLCECLLVDNSFIRFDDTIRTCTIPSRAVVRVDGCDCHVRSHESSTTQSLISARTTLQMRYLCFLLRSSR